MRFVPIKTEEHLDLQAVHRVRERWVMRRTAVVNQIRGLLLERGLTLPKGRSHVDHALPEILTDPTGRLSGSFRVLLGQLHLELEQLTTRIEQMDAVIQQTARENEACQRSRQSQESARSPQQLWLPLSAMAPAFGEGETWRPGSGWSLESIPRAASRSCSASARVGTLLRRLFVQGARVVMRIGPNRLPG
jgi:transposase